MKKILNFMKKKIKMFSFLSMILLIVLVNVVRVNADYMDNETAGNKKERQLLKKIDIIKEAFPNQIDKEALYATLTHRGTFTDYIEEAYDENFDEEEFKDIWTSVAESFNSVIDNAFNMAQVMALTIPSAVECFVEYIVGEGTENEHTESYYETNCVLRKVIEKYSDIWSHTTDENLEESIKKPKTVDLLTAATFVMLDSSGWVGNYSDENYKKALAGEGMVGNLIHDDNLITNFIATAFNGVFCTVRNVMDLVSDGAFDDFALSGFNPSVDFSELDGFTTQGVSMADKLSRYYTMDRICALGFIGGTYEHVQNPDLSTENGEELYQRKKDVVAQQIIDLAKYYRGENGGLYSDCISYGATGAFSEWKQYDDRWANVSIGSSTVRAIGCTTTSIAIQIARSGTQITNLPSGYTEFNPGALATSLSANGGYTGQLITWGGYDDIAPNVKFTAFYSFVSSNESEIASKISEILQTPILGQYQPFVILQMRHNGGEHWVAVQGVENGQVVINDPGRDGTSLSGNYSGEVWQVEGYKIMYATDVPFGSSSSSGSSSSGGSSSSSDNYCTATSGNIVIPEEFGNGGYTVTFYLNSDNLWNWDPTSNQGNFYYNYWLPSGAQFDNGIAVYEGRYLIACTETFGKVGDKIDFFLDDGTRIPCIIADAKRVTPNENSNEWGHNQGQNVIEFEVSRAYYNKYGNPGSANWFPEWAGKRVSSATNLGENVLGI